MVLVNFFLILINMNDFKQNLEDIFEILYQQDKLKLAGFIQEIYFGIDEEFDDEDYEYESDTESDEYYPEYISDEEFEIDEEGFFSMV